MSVSSELGFCYLEVGHWAAAFWGLLANQVKTDQELVYKTQPPRYLVGNASQLDTGYIQLLSLPTAAAGWGFERNWPPFVHRTSSLFFFFFFPAYTYVQHHCSILIIFLLLFRYHGFLIHRVVIYDLPACLLLTFGELQLTAIW